jgi:hypothetical protein
MTLAGDDDPREEETRACEFVYYEAEYNGKKWIPRRWWSHARAMRDKIKQDAKPPDSLSDAMQEYQRDLYRRMIARSPGLFDKYTNISLTSTTKEDLQGLISHGKTLFPGQVPDRNTEQEGDK